MDTVTLHISFNIDLAELEPIKDRDDEIKRQIAIKVIENSVNKRFVEEFKKKIMDYIEFDETLNAVGLLMEDKESESTY